MENRNNTRAQKLQRNRKKGTNEINIKHLHILSGTEVSDQTKGDLTLRSLYMGSYQTGNRRKASSQQDKGVCYHPVNTRWGCISILAQVL